MGISQTISTQITLSTNNYSKKLTKTSIQGKLTPQIFIHSKHLQ